MKVFKKSVTVMLVIALMMSTVNISGGGTLTSAEKLNHLGLLLNISESELEAQLTREIGLTMILKALGYTQDQADTYSEGSPFEDTNSWSKGWIALAYELKITTGTTDTTFSPQKLLSEREFLTFLLRALGHDSSKAYSDTESLSRENGIIGSTRTIQDGDYTKNIASIAMFNSLSATYIPENIPLANVLMDKGLFTLNQAVTVGLKDGHLEILRIRVVSGHELQVVFNKTVDKNKVTFFVEQENASYGATASWNPANTIATIVTASDLEKGTYTIKANYLSTSTTSYEQEFSIYGNAEAMISVRQEAVELMDNALLDVRLLDKYNNPIYDNTMSVVVTNIDINQEINMNQDAYGKYKLTNLEALGTRLGDTIEVSVTLDGESYVKNLNVVETSPVESFELINPVVNNGRLEMKSYNLELDYFATSENGAAYMLPKHAVNKDGRLSSETIDFIIFTSSNQALINVDKMKVDSLGVLRFNIEDIPGVVVLTAKNTLTNEQSQITITVYGDPIISTVLVNPPTTVVAVGETIELDVTAYDQFGALYDYQYVGGLMYTSSKESVVPWTSMKMLDNVFKYTGEAEGVSTLSVYSEKNELLFSMVVEIVESPEPIGIMSVNIPRFFEASEDATFKLNYSDVMVTDQYNREYDLNENNEVIVIEHEDETEDNIDFGSDRLTASGITVKGTDVYGSGTYRFTVEDIAYATIVVSIETIETEDIEQFEIADIESMEVGLPNAIELNLLGLTDNGDEIVLATDKISYVASSDPEIATVTYDGNVVKVQGVSGGTVTLTVWQDGIEIATSSVTVEPEEEDE